MKPMRYRPSAARTFAMIAHGDQKYGAHPYIKHLDDVASICRVFKPEWPDLESLAYLHDILEDTETKAATIRERWGNDMVSWLLLVTDPPGPNRAERKKRQGLLLCQENSRREEFHPAYVVKAADRLANIRACIEDINRELLSMYASEHHQFTCVAKLDGLCDGIWEEMDLLLGVNHQ